MSSPSQQHPSSVTHTSLSANVPQSNASTIAITAQAQTRPNILNGILLPPTTNKPISASPPPQPIAPMDKSKAAQKAKDAAVEGDANPPKPKQVRKKRGFYKKTLLRMQAEAEAKARAAEIAKAEAESRAVPEHGATVVATPTSSTVGSSPARLSTSEQGTGGTTHPVAVALASSPVLQNHQQQQQQRQSEPQKQQPPQHLLQQQQLQQSISTSASLPPRHDSPSISTKHVQGIHSDGSTQQSNAQDELPTMIHKSKSGHAIAAQGSSATHKPEEPKNPSLSKGRNRDISEEWGGWIQIKEEQSSQPLHRQQPAREQEDSHVVEKLGIKSSKHQSHQSRRQYLHQQQHPSSQLQEHFHRRQSQRHDANYSHAEDDLYLQATTQAQSPFRSRIHSINNQRHNDDQADDDDIDDVEGDHDTRADLEEELAMLAQEAEDERKRQELRDQRDLERAQKTSQALSLLRDLKSKLRGATEILGHSLQYQSGDMISQIFDEVLDEIGRDNLEVLNALTDKRLKQQDEKYTSILTSPEHADHIMTRSAVAAQLQASERPTKHDLVSRRGRTKPHTVTRRLPGHSLSQKINHSQHHRHKGSQVSMEESDTGDLGDHEEDYSGDQFVGQAWSVHDDSEQSTSSNTHHHLLNGSNRSSILNSAHSSKRSYSSSQRADNTLVARPKKTPRTSSFLNFSSSTMSSSSDTLHMLSIAEDELRRRQKADFEALQRKHYNEFQELQRWMQKQHEEFQSIEFAKTRKIREQLERHATLSLEQGGSSRLGREGSNTRQLTFGGSVSPFEYEDGDAGNQSPEHSSPPQSPSPPSHSSLRLQKKLRRDSTIITQQKPSPSLTTVPSAVEFDQDRLIRASQQAGLARTPSSSSLKLNGVHHKLTKQMLKNRDGLPMSTMNLALTAMSEKRKLLKRASKLNMGTAQPLPEEQDEDDDESDDFSDVLRNSYRSASPSSSRFSPAVRGPSTANDSIHRANEGSSRVKASSTPKRAETHTVEMNSPFLVHDSSRSDTTQHSFRSTTAQQMASPSPAPMSPPSTLSRKVPTGANKRRKNSSAGRTTQKNESSHASLTSSSSTNETSNLNQTFMHHYNHQWKSDTGTNNLFDLMLSDPPEFDVDESEVESMLTSNPLNKSGKHRRSDGTGVSDSDITNNKHKELNATPTSNAFKWYQKQQQLAEDLARQPKIMPLRLEGLTDDDSSMPTTSAASAVGTNPVTPFDLTSFMGESNNSKSSSATLFGEDHGNTSFNLSNGLGGNNSNVHRGDDTDPPSSASLLPLDYIPASSPVSPAMDMLFSEDGHDHDTGGSAGLMGDWGFKALSNTTGGDLTDEYLHPESPESGDGGSRNFLEF
ncbi:hypothetical protein BGW42_003115 [Actinomortierella wolfii]|nr:hypothetical protein BGW42_003115 [Actinomortierella wolfii]